MVHSPATPLKPGARSAFTLIELLVVIAIIGLLAALLFPAVKGALERGRTANEMALARNLMMGVYNYAYDHDGKVLPGYRNEPATGPDGATLPFPASARYPWRLMPYAGGINKRIMWADTRGRDLSAEDDWAYAVSLTPTLGMNTFFVGGDDSGNSGQGIRPTIVNYGRFGKFCVTRIDEAIHPSRLIVFASARMTGSSGRSVPGYFMIQAPRVGNDLWTSAPFDENMAPARHGYVDFRHQGRAVVAQLDGSVATLDEESMRDQRRWSNLAAQADDPEHRLQR